MSYSGAGVFNINSAGQPVVAATTISSTVFNALTADLATGLSTAICKDGQTTTTASIPFAAGIQLTGTASNINLGANFISYAGTDAGLSLDASNNATLSGNLRVDGGLVYLNDTANSMMTLGLTINQGANDNEILSLKSSDVAHGITGETETDTFAFLKKYEGANGGMQLSGWSGGGTGLYIQGAITTDETTRSTVARGAIVVSAALKSGGGVTALNANSNILTVQTLGTTRFILDSDGDSHQDVGTAWTNFDVHDDLQIMDALAMTLNRGDVLRVSFVQSLENACSLIENLPGKPIVQFNEDGHHFANMSRVTMLHHGAIRQIGQSLAQLQCDVSQLRIVETRLKALEARLQ